MHLSWFVLLYSSTFASASALPGEDLLQRWGIYERHESQVSSCNQWTKSARASKDELIHLRIALKQRNLELADQFVHAVSSPDSPRYAQHWTFSQVANTFAATDDAVAQTLAWLKDHGITDDRRALSAGRNWIEVQASVAEVEMLLSTKLHVYQRSNSNDRRIACEFYSLPTGMKRHIDFVMPTIHLDGLQRVSRHSPRGLQRRQNPTETLSGTKHCKQDYITIDCMRAAYNFGEGNYSLGTLGIGEWSNFLSQSDLELYFQNWTRPRIPSGTYPSFTSIDGGQTLAKSGSSKTFESGIDFDIAYSVTYPQELRLYQVGDGVNVDGSGTFNIFLDALDGTYCTYKGGDAPYIDPLYPDPNKGGYNGTLQCGGAPFSDVISISYGQIEAALPVSYQRRQCYEWMKMALQGVTVVFGSGDVGVANDLGVGGATNATCINAKTGYQDQNGKRFNPSFPSTCPYITAVGATYLKTNDIHGGEVAAFLNGSFSGVSSFYSGGGFSNVFARPRYQKSVVTKYLKHSAPAYGAQIYNRTGRGFPDVSAFGLNIAVVSEGTTQAGGGTSASAPLFASVISLINAERLHAGKKAVGFINPVMYKNPHMFNDVTEGSNPGCGSKGFAAVEGWDPVTGLGTPNYEKMKKVWLSLP